ncbi:MAG: DNA-binding domain-containing protein [Alphaproteobacteria bacterium]|nr:DNA-binding domain-containing protein [Alphaproteobacteria bacterium]
MTLKNLQRQFLNFIYKNEELGSAKSDIIASSLKDSMAIYRSHVWYSLINTLESHYDSVVELLGHKLFLKIAQEYVAQHPSHTPDLELYGLEFPEFLERYKSIPSSASDIASINISYVKASISEDFKTNTIQEFKDIKQEDYERIIFHTNPTNIICNLEYDVIRYFEYSRSENKSNIAPQIAKSKNIIVVNRTSDHNVQHTQISSLELEFIKECNKGSKFIDVFEKLHNLDKNLNLQKILANLIENQLVIRFTIN